MKLTGVLALLIAPCVCQAQDATPGDTPKGPAQLKQTAKFERVGAFAELILAPDEDSLYVLDLESAKVYKIKADDLTLAGELRTVERASILALAPSGKTLYAAACDAQASTGTFQVIDTATFKGAEEFKIDGAPLCGMVATDAGVIACTIPGANEGGANRFVAIDAAKHTVLARADITNLGQGRGSHANRPRIHLPPEQDRAYIMGDYAFIRVDLKPGDSQWKPRDLGGTHGTSLGADFLFSPDGSLCLVKAGNLLRLGSGREFGREWQVDGWICAAFSRDSKEFVVAREEGKLRRYDIAAHRAVASYRLEASPTSLVWDRKRSRLIVLTPAQEQGSGLPLYGLTAFDVPK